MLTQDCDLDWDYKARDSAIELNKRERKLVPSVLLCELFTERELRSRFQSAGTAGHWKRVCENRDERYHYFPSRPEAMDRMGLGLPTLIADFKRVFTIPTDEMYRRLHVSIHRRVVLRPVFLQHFANRFGYYMQRVALPEITDEAQLMLPSGEAPNQQIVPAQKKSAMATLIAKVKGLLGFPRLKVK